MNKLQSVFFYYNWTIISLLIISGLVSRQIFINPTTLTILVPLIVYFWGFLIINIFQKSYPSTQLFWISVSILVFFNFVSTALLTISNFVFSQQPHEYVFSLFYLPLPAYFFLTISSWYRKIQKINRLTTPTAPVSTAPSDQPVLDKDRRQFLKLVGSAGISVFLLSLLNPKKASAAFFGSVPGPGTVALKDTSGAKINPAEKQPTDGYKVSQIDDASSPAYYGFVNQSGSWYIMREDSSGDYRYVRGSANFSSSWTSRASLSYDYFDTVF